MKKDLDRARSGAVSEFLQTARAIQTVTRRQARLIFALDATASREPTWDQARSLQGELFSAAASETALAVQLCYYRGLGEFEVTEWLTQPGALLDQMTAVTCQAGTTQIRRVVSHALQAGSPSHRIRALVFVGDACEEPSETLLSLAGQCGVRQLPIFLFQEGDDASTRSIFRQMAGLSGGASLPFDADSAEKLRMSLGAVARFAAGGIKALQRSNSAGDRMLLEQLEKKS